MALGSFFDIPEWQLPASDSPDLDLDDAGPVGLELPPPQVTATRIAVGERDEVELFEEVDIHVIRGRNLDLSTTPEYPARPCQLANTVEVKCSAERCGTNHTLVVAAYPYGADWFAASRFKPARFESFRRGPDATQASLHLIQQLQVSDDPQALLEQADFDPFETREKWMTARFIGPFERTPGGHITVRTRGKRRRNSSKAGVTVSPPNRTLAWRARGDDNDPTTLRKLPPTWLWGICENLNQCHQILMDSPEAKQILENPESVLLNPDSRGLRPSYVIRDEQMLELFCSLGRSGMRASIMKALAGMPPRQPLLWKQGVRKRAIDLACQIYRDFALNLAKRLGAEQVRIVSGRDTDGASPLHPIGQSPCSPVEGDGAASGPPDIKDEVEDREREWKEKLEGVSLGGNKGDLWFELIRQKLGSEDEEELIDGCGMIAASAGVLDLPGWIARRIHALAENQKQPRTVRSLRYTLERIRLEGD